MITGVKFDSGVKFDWENLSSENLKIARKVIKVISDFLQFQPMGRFSPYTVIPLQRFEEKRICIDDINMVLDKIDDIKVSNDELRYEIKYHPQRILRWFYGNFTDDGLFNVPPEKILKNYIFLQISSISDLRRVQGLIDERLKIDSRQKEEILSPNYLKSIHLITKSLEPTDVIFLVLDERFEYPIRSVVWHKGNPTYVKKLYDIAYFVDVPNKKVNYGKNIANSINNGLFRKRPVAEYMETNKFKKPTLVQKSENKTLVLKNEILVETGLIHNKVPKQYQYLYIDKTR